MGQFLTAVNESSAQLSPTPLIHVQQTDVNLMWAWTNTEVSNCRSSQARFCRRLSDLWLFLLPPDSGSSFWGSLSSSSSFPFLLHLLALPRLPSTGCPTSVSSLPSLSCMWLFLKLKSYRDMNTSFLNWGTFSTFQKVIEQVGTCSFLLLPSSPPQN